MTNAHRIKRRHHAMAARQALRLCEAELLTSAGTSGHGAGPAHPGQPRVSTAGARAALVAAGLPPHLAAALRRRLHLLPDQEAQP